MDFIEFPKIARLTRDCVVTEKIDGTNASVTIVQSLAPEDGALAHRSLGDAGDLSMFAGSRTRWITPEDDNFGFAKWVKEHADELWALGPGSHFGEWWGQGIQRNYGLTEKRFSLFNVKRWVPYGEEPQIISQPNPKAAPRFQDVLPPCVGLVPVLYRGPFDTPTVDGVVNNLRYSGSIAAPGFMKPEGVVVFHNANGTLFKKTIEKDAEPKGRS